MPSRLTLVALLVSIAAFATARAQETSPPDETPESEASESEKPEKTSATENESASDEDTDSAKEDSSKSESSKEGTASPHGGVPDAITGLPLWNNVQLHGRFDLNYERRGYNSNPFSHDAYDTLQNYHHFLFLVRDSKDDPFTFNIEVISQQWYELGYRFSPADTDWRFQVKAGRILVPFGSDPLYHHTYGGLSGFDQQFLPVVWSQLGATVNAQYRWRDFNFSDDVFAIQGYKLSRADAILNLQSDFAPSDDTRIGVGNRLAAAWGPMALYYSAYYNQLGFGRRVFMQALDFSLARFHGIPILEHFTLDAGIIRADVSGGASRGYGGPNDDYYHFADYLQVRYYPFYWLYVQARTGIKTFNNRRGVTIDRSDLTVEDTSAYNIGVVARYRGLTGGIFHFWNLERRDEIKNDFLRVAVTYEF